MSVAETDDVPARSAAPIFALTTLALAGCAGTRTMHQGFLPNREPLVTVVVSADRSVVEEECRPVPSLGPILGCQILREVALPDGRQARAVKIVRYTDHVPSEMAAEIEAHELCHTVAALQAIEDPCHTGTNGFIQARSPR
jgi:hypothetical protein